MSLTTLEKCNCKEAMTEKLEVISQPFLSKKGVLGRHSKVLGRHSKVLTRAPKLLFVQVFQDCSN
ncbi:hypothetical protein [Methanosarcina barkeri]|uniref:hypothetical protein n=1 Tax=Methanosarcina barkeri TaxID=2208 RepID=UPI00064E4E1D|nr:hypothetical protein [Methanosarcina barkeri]